MSKYKNINTSITCRCLKDGYEWLSLPTNLLRGHGCPVCSGRKVMKGINDIATTNPEMLCYLTDINDGFKYTACSHEKISFTCPDCGHKKKAVIKNIHYQGFCCDICGDGISYPNKFLRSLLSQLPVQNLDFEYSPSWIKPKAYDSYFEYHNKKYIVEMDGDFHFKDNKMNNQTKEESQEIDSYKDLQATKHDITIIRIPCRDVTYGRLCNEVSESQLNTIFDLSIIDFQLCGEHAASNFQKEVCMFFNENKFKMSYLDIANHFHISETTVSRYLKNGKMLEWISITEEEERVRRLIHTSNPKSYQINIIDSDNNVLWNNLSINGCYEVLKMFYGIIVGRKKIIKSLNSDISFNGFKLVSSTI